MNWHPDGPPMFHHTPWWQSWQGLIPLLLIIALAGVVIWLVVRMNRMQAAGAVAGGSVAAGSAGVVPPAPAPTDAALEQARMRYANGDIDRTTFLALWSDLGGAPAATPAASSESAPEAPAPEPGDGPEGA